MRTITAYQAKTHLGRYLKAVRAGESFTITHHGSPIARLVAAENGHDKREAQLAVDAILETRRGRRLGSRDWRRLRDEGRR